MQILNNSSEEDHKTMVGGQRGEGGREERGQGQGGVWEMMS